MKPNYPNLHVHNKDLAMFVGVEMEGLHKGDKTLFVKGLVPFDKIHEAFKAHNCERLYFGAGRLSSFSVPIVNRFINTGIKVTVESQVLLCLSCFEDQENLTVHYTLAMPGVPVTFFEPLLSYSRAKVLYKVDIGDQCIFFDQPPLSTNSFDGYPSDEIIYYESAT